MPEPENKQEADVQVNEQDINQQVDANVDVNKEADTKVNEQQSEQKETNETREGLISKIRNIIRRKPDDGTDDGGDANAGTDDGTGEGKDVPAEFTDAAIKAGMSPQQIEDFASDYEDAQLLEQIPVLLAQVSEDSDKSEQPSKKEAGDTQQEAEKKDDDKSGDDAKDEEIRLLKERLDKVEKGQQKSTDRDAEDKLVSMASRANKRMDELSKEFEVFGTYETLPRFPHNNQIIPTSPAVKARNEVWHLAEDLEKAGMDFDQALEISLNAFKGKNLANDVKRNLVKDLKKSEKKLSAKHSSHESVKTHSSGVDVVREVKRKHGIE